MLNVLHISTHNKGGAGNASYRLHLALNENGTVNSRFLQRGDTASFDEKIYKIPQRKHLFYHKIANKLGIPILNWHKNRKIIENNKGDYEKISFPCNDFLVEDHPWVQEADIINLHWISDFINYPSFFKSIQHKKVIWTLHDMNPFKGLFHYQEDETRNNKDFGKIDSLIKIQKAKEIKRVKNLQIVCPSNWLADIAKKSEIFNTRNVTVIPYSLPENWFKLRDKGNAKHHYKLKNGVTTILFVALDIDIERKGLKIILEALKQIPSEQIQLLIVGNRDFEFPNNHVVKTGYIDTEENMILAYAAADVYILPSKEDNLPNVMLESFAQGTPVISFKNGGMQEWIKDGFNGYICDDINSISLGSKIQLFLLNQDKFNRNTINQFACKNFHPSIQAEAYKKLYYQINNEHT